MIYLDYFDLEGNDVTYGWSVDGNFNNTCPYCFVFEGSLNFFKIVARNEIENSSM